jgi:hypothetical protein
VSTEPATPSPEADELAMSLEDALHRLREVAARVDEATAARIAERSNYNISEGDPDIYAEWLKQVGFLRAAVKNVLVAAPSSSGEAQRVEAVPLSVLEQLRHYWQDEAGDPRWLAFTAADALLECAADLQRLPASGEAQDPPEAEMVQVWECRARRGSSVGVCFGPNVAPGHGECGFTEPTPAGGEGTDR